MSIQPTLCYPEKDGCYLMLHRVKKKNDVNRDKWIGIGGKFEPGESPEDCMNREFTEETGMEATAWKYRGIVTFVSEDWCEYMHLFSVSAFTGTMRDCDEGELAWIPKKELYELPMWEGDRIFLDLLDDINEPFFSLKLVYSGEKLVSAFKNGEQIR